MTLLNRIGLSIPLIGLSALIFGITLIGARGLWNDYTSGERVATTMMCILTGCSLAVSISVALDRRIDSLPWRRIIAIIVLLVMSFGLALVRRQLILNDV